MPLRPSMARLLDPFNARARARSAVRDARLKREANEKRLRCPYGSSHPADGHCGHDGCPFHTTPVYEDRSGGYQGSESHVTGRNLDGPMG